MKLLDLFCGAGGAAMGYHRAGFEVTGVDIAPQPRFPLLDLHLGDALDFLTDPSFLNDFDAIHASPPCQAYTDLRHRTGRTYPNLVGVVRELLDAWGGPYVMENVEGSPLRPDLVLCGSQFGLGHGDAVLRRHRLFEANVALDPPTRPDSCRGRRVVGVYGSGGAWTRTAPGGGGVKVSGRDAAAALGIDWTAHQASLAQAIPPAYTEHIGAQLLDHLREVAA